MSRVIWNSAKGVWPERDAHASFNSVFLVQRGGHGVGISEEGKIHFYYCPESDATLKYVSLIISFFTANVSLATRLVESVSQKGRHLDRQRGEGL